MAVCPELDGLWALGPTQRAAVEELETVVQLAVTTYGEEGWPLPDLRVAVCDTLQTVPRGPSAEFGFPRWAR
ncbi:MAG TPA: hypothetical protein VLH09_09530 [Bryobacteraceae bacterium]|nr:hypothetical protein [Bryobacteraceae bacterium]